MAKMDVRNECVSCGSEFVKEDRKKHYNRRSLGSSFRLREKTERNIANVLEEEFDISVTPLSLKTRFVCEKCSKSLSSFHKAKHVATKSADEIQALIHPLGYLGRKIKLTPSKTPRKVKKLKVSASPLKKPSANSVPQSHSSPVHQTVTVSTLTKKRFSSENEVERAIKYIKLKKYERGLKILMKTRVGAKKAITNIVKKEIRSDVSRMLNDKKSSFRSESKLDEMEKFRWDDAFNESQKNCPMLSNILIAALTSEKSEKFLGLRFKKDVSAMPTIGLISAIIAFKLKPYTYKLIQQMNSIQMWLSGCKREAFGRFNHLGLCIGIKGTRGVVDKIRIGYDTQVKKWKGEVSDVMMMKDFDENGTTTSETIPYAENSEGSTVLQPLGSEFSSSDTISSSAIPTEISDTEPAPRVKNTQDEPSASSNTQENTTDNCCYSICFDNVNQKLTVRHQTRDRKNKMFNMVQAYCAKDRVPTLHLNDTQPEVEMVQNIPLEKYLPSIDEERQLKDEITVVLERILVETITAFNPLKDEVNWHIHHPYSEELSRKSEMIPLGVMDKDESRVGDMVEIMAEYNKYVPMHPNGLPVVIPLHADGLSCERVNDAQNARVNALTPWLQLQGFEANIQEWHKRCLLYQDTFDELYDGKSARDKGTLFQLKNYFGHRNVTGNVKESFNFVEEFLEFVTKGYVTLSAMHFANIENIDDLPENFPESKEEQLQYLKNTAASVLDLIFISSQPIVNGILGAKDDGTEDYHFCTCKEEIPGSDMVYCDNKNCPRGQWFHLDCMNMTEDDVPDDAWYCSASCRNTKGKKGKKGKKQTVASKLSDGKREYVRQLMWRGINQYIRKDAVKEGDGERIILHWKFDMLDFYEHSHPKYFIFCHRLLSNINGAASKRLAHSLVWNRTVNVKGGKGNNIPMDLQMEFFNREYKESVKDAAGNLTEATVARHSQMVNVGKVLTKVYDEQIALHKSHTRASGKPDSKKDLQDFVDLLEPEKFLEVRPGRSFGAFPDFEFRLFKKIVVKSFKARLMKHRKFMADRRTIVLNRN